MTRQWRYFVAAVLISALLLWKCGAPPIAIAVGIAGAALLMWRRTSRVS